MVTDKLNFKDVLNSFPTPFNSEHCSRELASFYRSDLVWFCSDFERMKVFQNFKLQNTGLITFFYDNKEIELQSHINFARRKNFVWIGNFYGIFQLKY